MKHCKDCKYKKFDVLMQIPYCYFSENWEYIVKGLGCPKYKRKWWKFWIKE